MKLRTLAILAALLLAGAGLLWAKSSATSPAPSPNKTATVSQGSMMSPGSSNHAATMGGTTMGTASMMGSGQTMGTSSMMGSGQTMGTGSMMGSGSRMGTGSMMGASPNPMRRSQAADSKLEGLLQSLDGAHGRSAKVEALTAVVDELARQTQSLSTALGSFLPMMQGSVSPMGRSGMHSMGSMGGMSAGRMQGSATMSQLDNMSGRAHGPMQGMGHVSVHGRTATATQCPATADNQGTTGSQDASH